MLKCPKCGTIFEGRPDHCPICGVKLAFPEPKAKTQTKILPDGRRVVVKKKKAQKRVPPLNLPTNRHFIKYILLCIITLGIYGLVFEAHYRRDINVIRIYHGHQKRISFLPIFLLSIITAGIPMIIFNLINAYDTYRYASRAKAKAHGSFVFYILSVLLLSWTVICPIIAIVQMFRTMNSVCGALNRESRQ